MADMRMTNLKDMDAPGVGSGKDADETVLKGQAEYPSPAEKGPNILEQYTTESQPKKNIGGEATF